MNLEMIIFDLDGTLWETEKITYKTANAVAKKYNLGKEITLDTIRKTMGCTFTEAAYNYIPELEKEEREKIFSEILSINCKILEEFGGNVYDRLEETLKTLKNEYKLAIVSNCGAGYIESFLNSSKLTNYFVDYMAAAKYKVSKADAIRKVMTRNAINDAIYVGDTIKDYEASQGANIEFVQAKYGFGDDLNTEYSIQDISELPDIIKNM